MLLYPPIIKK